MTPQDNMMVVAPVREDREAELRQMLDHVNRKPGVFNPENPYIHFHTIETLHFARFVIFEDSTREDLLAYGDLIPSSETSLALLCDFDGSSDAFLQLLIARCGPGLVQIFSCCKNGPSLANLTSWLHEHYAPASAAYVNWIGRTVVQTREEEQLFLALEDHLDQIPGTPLPRDIWRELKSFAEGEKAAQRLRLTPEPPTPLNWKINNLVHCIGIPLLLLLLSPVLIICLPFFLLQLRMHEKTDPVIAPRPSPGHAHRLAELEDQFGTNQFSASGHIKPGWFRRWTITAVFMAIDYTSRHIFNRGFLARIVTIHYARWVFLGDHQRAFFATNYDGSLEAYMGDFINKVSWGLNVVFSNGLGYPRTDWLILKGAKYELTFKDYLRRHQLPTQVWYNATPHLTAIDKERNSRIRQGLEKPWLSDDDLKTWLSLF